MKYEDRFKGIFYGVADIVSLIDVNYDIMMVNKAYEKLLCRPADDCVGSKCYTIIRSRECPCEDCPILKTINRENGIDPKLLITIGSDKVSLTRHPIYDDQGVLLGVFEIGRIVTRELKMELELQHHERLKIMGELAASISHEIKNPLAGIGLMTVSLMERLNQKDSIYQDLGSILQEVQRLEKLLEGLMDFAGPGPFILKMSNIHHPIDTTLKLLDEKLKSGKIRVKKIYNLKLPKVLIDSSKMQQVFFNLFLNSITAMPNGGDLIITTDILPQKIKKSTISKGVQVTIQDNGVGIKEEDLTHIFDPFFSKGSQGTGLGLSIVSRIIELHNGSIKVQSEEGSGTTVRVYIPLD
jgi:signal transduction histidine kinase